ncbi:granulocyte colony-stimulating factor receptor-like isoform X1 [Petromyzon marinus]|uniref:granulocyte colony-stimulating factor receptor-like isoform X1 n=1 Tax=Petromyzon marinus TaxID=7757 RepID=UPI003F72ED5B
MSYTTVLNVAVIFSAAWQGTFCLPLSGRLQLSSNPVRAGGSLWAHCAVEMCPNNCLNHDFYIRLDGLRLQPSQSPATTTAELTSSNTTTNYVTTTATINTNGSTRISSRGTTTTTTPDGRAAVSGRECHVLSANVTVGSVKPPQGLVQCVVHCDLQGSVVVDEATVRVGYIPDAPSQPRCEVRGGEMGALSCSWKLGHDSLLKTDSQLCYQEVGKDKIKMCERVEGAQTVDLPGSKLDFHRHWELWVEVHNALGQSRSPPFSLMPNDFVTIEPPALQIVKYTHIADHISVKWTAQTGISIEYKCDLRLAYGNEEAWRTVFNRSLRSQIWDIHGLAPDTAYCVRIRCSQPVAKAPKGTWGQRKCFSTPPAQPLVGPEVWKILSPGPSDEVFNLTLLWKPLSAKEARGPVTSYHVMDRVNGETQAKVVQHGLESQPLYSLQLGKVQVPSEWCVQANNLAGSSPCSWLRLSARVLPAPFNVEAHEDKGSGGGGMAVRWAPPKPRGHERRRAVEGYVVEWVVADDDQTTPSMHWHCVPANTTHVVLSEHMKPLICYNISVVAIYETGEGKSGVVQAYAQQGVPNVGPKVSVANIALSSVDVNWTEIPTKERRGFITGHVIYWGQGPDASHRVLIRGSACAYTLKNLSASVEYSVMVAAMTEVGEGPPGAKTHFRMQGVLGCKGGPVEQDSLCSNATHELDVQGNEKASNGVRRRDAFGACGNRGRVQKKKKTTATMRHSGRGRARARGDAEASLAVCAAYSRVLRKDGRALEQIRLRLELKQTTSSVGQTRNKKRKSLRRKFLTDVLQALSSDRAVSSTPAIIEELDRMFGLWPHVSPAQPDADSPWPRALRERNKGCLSGSRDLPLHTRQCETVKGRRSWQLSRLARLLPLRRRWFGGRCSKQSRAGTCAPLCVTQRRVSLGQGRCGRRAGRPIQIKFTLCFS